MLRVLIRTSLALVIALVAAVIGWRVLAPAEVSSAAAAPYPVAVTRPPQVTGRTNQAPLIVAGAVRAYASKRQIRADAPVDAKSVMTAIWSLRRWPSQLSGVVAVGDTVISRWADGELVGISALSGKIIWRVSTGIPGLSFDGHRTGAATVWAPSGLHTGAGAVFVSGSSRVSAYDAATGAQRWSAPISCQDAFTTVGGQFVCTEQAFSLATGQAVAGWPAGPHTPLGCDVAFSACGGLRDSSGQGWLVTGAQPRRSTVLDQQGSTVAGGRAIPPQPGAQVLGASQGRLVLLTDDRHLKVGDTDFPLAVGTEKLTWKPGLWQVTDHWVAIERLAADSGFDPDKPGYYFTVDTVIIAAI
ncbi:outer membrane protein assembly factor BamB family protein [Paractinoplanes atraurantiacus]|uniref:PQQ-like domain-containing protein n=1 Tax=Paractinoplanes atraurantiacus TaxID=1036182 RepID=A0A285F0J2_9ACTN|nr:PQQ-binding-like beta-propeller repeat protein [Actinoplanes atraurantiacus]SNY04583.1 PQQ-like domain-containing protein [Actinoplanes atraurantiacus]